MDNVYAFLTAISAIAADRIVDEEEARQICFALPQWRAQLTEARDYVKEYRRVEPEMVNEPLNGLQTLEKQAEEGLALLNEADC